MFYALNSLSIRHLCADENTLTLLVWFFGGLGISGLIGTVLLPADGTNFVTRGWVEPSATFWALCLLQAIGSIIAVAFITRAYQMIDPSYMAVFEYSLLIFASFWAFVIFDQGIGLGAAAGMLLIIVSGVIIALRGHRYET